MSFQEVVQQPGPKCLSELNDNEFAEMLTIVPLLEQHKFFLSIPRTEGLQIILSLEGTLSLREGSKT